MTCIPAIVRLHGSALCCWQVTPMARGTAVAAAGRRSRLDTATGRNRMGIGFGETRTSSGLPILELHIREDHRRRGCRSAPDDGDSAGAGAPASQAKDG